MRLPLGRPDTEFEVVVIIQPKTANGKWAKENPFAVMDAIRSALAATGRDFGDSADEIRADRDR
ncbi:MAG TPA: hypothetical protein VGX78_19565 [Pirellulales bacterium]|nr:hypothetical protein [Pirellulales bacterium]